MTTLENSSLPQDKLILENFNFPEYSNAKTFEDLNLKKDLLRGIYANGWTTPSDIQKYSIIAISSNSDVLIQSQSGMGKTGAFSIGVLNKIQPENPSVQAIIILNTRELAQQVYEVVQLLSEYMKINIVLLTGGQGQGQELKETKRQRKLLYHDRATIFIGTPGKLGSLLERKEFTQQPINLRMFVIDEFDVTLETNFSESIEKIWKYGNMDIDTQLITVSATIKKHVMDMLNRTFKKDTIRITLNNDDVMLDGINHFYVNCENEYKFDTIMDLNNTLINAQTIIFVNSKKECQKLYQKLIDQRFTVSQINGQLSQEERNKIMNDFRNNNIRTLISTGMLSRGIDVNTVSLVINYELPTDVNEYIHRIGRSGRYGKKGLAISLVSKNEMKYLYDIEKFYKTKINELPSNLEQFC